MNQYLAEALERIAAICRNPMNSRDAGYVVSSDGVLEICEDALTTYYGESTPEGQ